ncbi:MAG TPA: ATP-binding protein, partial [Pirellulaceae bacterium]|nr:ATP-binding protein [Pirellulaceae bacterium]
QAEFRIYTPGSSAGRQLALLSSFAAPNQQIINDDELFRERVGSTASGLLALLGIDHDPIRSREHILISMILDHAWRGGHDVDLAKLIAEIQSPPFQRVGVVDMDTFFPAKDRTTLAMSINSLLASPSFSAWLQGEPMSIKNMLYHGDRPCISVLSIAHLSDAERMFFVTLLLEEVVAWMRTQSGTTALRAILFMDEVFGYFPPSRNPPSKKPMLTLMKQARAYGLGIVLATQNPVDLDYKGLSNAGTWFLGRLQTERDKARVLDGLEGAAIATGSQYDRAQLDKTLSGLGNRVFLMNNVHDTQPVLFETRWAMSYLRGPLTRQQIQWLTGSTAPSPVASNDPVASAAPKPAAHDSTRDEMRAPVESPADQAMSSSADQRRLIPPEVQQRFVQPANALDPRQCLYRPALWIRGRLHYVKPAAKIDHWQEIVLVRQIKSETPPEGIWEESTVWNARPDVTRIADEAARYAPVPELFLAPKHFKTWEREVRDYLFRSKPLVIFECAELKLVSAPGESESEFKIRLELAASERRDLETTRLRQKFAPKLNTLRDRKKRSEDRVDREKERLKQHKLTSILSTGQSLLGALLGRKKISVGNVGRASTAAKTIGRTSSKQAEVARAEESVEDVQARIEELEEEFAQAVAEMSDKLRVDQL